MSRQAKPLIIYDGVCHFCNRAVLFIISRDPQERFLFAPMQSKLAQEKIAAYCPNQLGIDTFILIKDGRALLWSSAALEILKDLDSVWRWLLILNHLPVNIRDLCYRLFARHRYRLFGLSKSCVVPDHNLRKRFLGINHE